MTLTLVGLRWQPLVPDGYIWQRVSHHNGFNVVWCIMAYGVRTRLR